MQILHFAGRNAINRERKGIACCKITQKRGILKKNTQKIKKNMLFVLVLKEKVISLHRVKVNTPTKRVLRNKKLKQWKQKDFVLLATIIMRH